MGKRRTNAVTMGFVVLIVLVVLLMMVNSLRRTNRITLPDPSGTAAQTGGDPQQTGEALIRVEVTPETVQAAIETLARPESYIRLLTVERLWSGGSGTTRVTVTVSGGLTRTDAAQPDGRTRRTITDGEQTYVWYDSDRTYYTGAAGDITADQEQGIPTYEDILALDANQIVTADYRTFADQACIYVETGEDQYGYALRYWVAVDSGLLVGSERLQNGETIYRMAAQPVTEMLPTARDFTLPDGTVLWEQG